MFRARELAGRLEDLGGLGPKGLVEIHGRIVRGTRTGFEGSAGEFFSRRRYFNLLQQHLSFGLMPEQVNQKTT